MGNLLVRCGWIIFVLSGCQEAPVVSGFPGTPPSHARTVAVWGNDTRTADAASLWLQQQGLTVLSQARLERVLARNAATENLPLLDDAAILEAAGEIGADTVVFSDRIGDVRPPMVSVKGVDVRNGRVIWTGNARYGSFSEIPTNDTLNALTDRALMSAWGLQPKED